MSSSSWLRLGDNDDNDNTNASEISNVQDMPDAIDELRNPRQAKDDFLRYLQEEVFKLNFYRAHMLYFIVIIAISSVIVYGQGLADGPEEVGGVHLTFTNALFLCCSAMTTTGMFLSASIGT